MDDVWWPTRSHISKQMSANHDDDAALLALLTTISLSRLAPTFREEELTLGLLKQMATDPDDDGDGSNFLASMDELEISAADAATLRDALSSPSASGTPAAATAEPSVSVDDTIAAARAAIEVAAQPPKLETKWTPDGPRMVPSEDGVDNVMAALAAMGAAKRATATVNAAASVDTDALLASALASVSGLDTKTSDEPSRPRVRSKTQINHVSSAAAKQPPSSVDHGTSNKALEAYHRRRVLDPHGINGDTAFDGGTIPAPLARARETARAREEEAKYRDKHAFVGENYNDL